MKIAFNPSTVAALTTPPNNKDITFDLRGRNIFTRGVKFYGTDTNTWRDIKINNVSIGSHTLDLRNGSNTTLTNTNGVVTINSTWRPVVDNLTSDSTTSSLSAKQGKVLKALIDGKSNSDHNHDGRYVRAFGTSNDNIDSDWGQSFKTFDPIPLGTPPEKNSNISLLSIGENFNRRKQLAFIYSNDNIYYRRHIDSGFTNWRRLAFANEIPTSLKNPYALTISLNGTSQGPYDGSAAKNINITPGSIGAAVSNHSHDYLVVNSADNKSFNSAYHNFQVLYAGGGNGITGKPANVDAFGLFKFRAGSGWSGQMLLANGGSLYIRSSEDAKMTNTLAWKTILDSSNYSGILDSRYYTESEVNSLLSRKLDRVNLTTGSWNPRGQNLAADYYYNGGDLSISESGGEIHVSVDGYFWQNEGQYRVLDTSDIAGLKSSLTVYQYLLATDTTWYPLVWGGDAHQNTSDSTGAVYKSYDKLSWQTSSQTLYATNIQTNNIKGLSIGGGIYWNPYVESASDGSDAASITLVRSGVAGGTTLVLSQMNDTNDTIQFKTNTAARLYHNNYPILTTQNTYVSNNKGYINGTQITQVNNSDTVDGYHENSFLRYRGATYTDQEATLWSQIGIKQYNNALPDNLTGVYNYGSVISLPGFGSRFEIYASQQSSNGNGLYYRSGWDNEKKAWLKFIDSSNIRSQSVNYANSAGHANDADTVDGVHANGLLTALSNSNNGISITVGGTTKSISNISVNHANSAGNADTLGGMPKNYGRAPFGTIPYIGNDGVMEIGRYIDFHSDNSGSYDYSTRIQANGNYKNTVQLPSASGTLALTTYGGDYGNYIFLGYLDLYNGNDGTIRSSFLCLGYPVPFTYTRGGSYCIINIPDTSFQMFGIRAAIASVQYSGTEMGQLVGNHRGDGAWWLHCQTVDDNTVQVKGFHLANKTIDSWWGGNPLYSGDGAAKTITVCLFGCVIYK